MSVAKGRSMHSIPDGWEYWATETSGSSAAWSLAVRLKLRREVLRPDLFVRVKVVQAGGAHWILRREETRQETGT